MTTPAAVAPPTIDADIASFIASGEATGDVAPAAAADDTATADPEVAAVAAPATVAVVAPVVSAAMLAAIEKSDPRTFIEALGDKAEALLGSAAHKVLRLQVRDAQKAEQNTAAAVKRVQAADAALEAKFRDPVAIHNGLKKGGPEGADMAVEALERWAGCSWLDFQKFVAAAQAGRPARLEMKAQAAREADQTAKAAQDKATGEAQAWVSAGLAKEAPELAKEKDLDVGALVLAELKAGWSKGVNTPAKALPLVRAKLKAQYEALGRIFGKGAKPPAAATPPSPSTRVVDGAKTRPLSLNEEIAAFAKENRWT